MRTLRALSLVGLIAFCSCAIQPGHPRVDGNASAVSSEDIQQAIAAAQKGILGGRPSGAAYRVHVIDRNNVEVYFGEHYGLGAPMGAVIYVVERAGGRWVAAGIKFGLTNRSSQPLAAVKSTFDFMKQFFVFATLVPASGGSTPSR